MSQNTDYLTENGPAPLSKLPNGEITVYDRKNGVWKFNTTGSNSALRKGGHTRPIYYLKKPHDPVDIVVSWLSHNKKAVESLSRTSLRKRLQSNGPEFHEAIDQILPSEREYDGGAEQSQFKCRICDEGEILSHQLPDHIVTEHGSGGNP